MSRAHLINLIDVGGQLPPLPKAFVVAELTANRMATGWLGAAEAPLLGFLHAEARGDDIVVLTANRAQPNWLAGRLKSPQFEAGAAAALDEVLRILDDARDKIVGAGVLAAVSTSTADCEDKRDKLDARELAAILAGLRCYLGIVRLEPFTPELEQEVLNVANANLSLTKLSAQEVEQLCRELA